ncbi:MAG TPA: gamma-glutamyl-gamma-aminobutyrate hydrolase family protein [Solirubrobacteraceae bacterium]|nr:gamma-glutamyl-gamma-aminobutyrate hydrolase family protein [Solirubrobacteraceae bacterium]
MARPVIGICTALERARWSVWDQQAALLPRNYVEAVQGAGGLALMIPPDPSLVEDPVEVLELIDGLMLAGGVDIDPASYGEPRHEETTSTVPERDVFELALLRAAIARELPVLGICRGMQLINVAHGGTLFQHLPERFGHHEHCRVAGSFDDADHDVLLAEGSLVAQIVGGTSHATKSHHHQGVDRLGEGLVVTGTSAIDGLPEALELDGQVAEHAADGASRPFLLGVQWHPEADETSPVVGALVAAAQDVRVALSDA